MFYLLKPLLFLNLIIFKLKCNNLTFNEILILYASYVCLLYSRFIKNHPIWILKDGYLISKVVLSHRAARAPGSKRLESSHVFFVFSSTCLFTSIFDFIAFVLWALVLDLLVTNKLQQTQTPLSRGHGRVLAVGARLSSHGVLQNDLKWLGMTRPDRVVI
jgi:hypothetical protein